MRNDLPPAAVCTVCGTYDLSDSRINVQCSERHNGNRCKGVRGSALNKSDWTECSNCDGNGCDRCQSSGWIFIRPSV